MFERNKPPNFKFLLQCQSILKIVQIISLICYCIEWRYLYYSPEQEGDTVIEFSIFITVYLFSLNVIFLFCGVFFKTSSSCLFKYDLWCLISSAATFIVYVGAFYEFGIYKNQIGEISNFDFFMERFNKLSHEEFWGISVIFLLFQTISVVFRCVINREESENISEYQENASIELVMYKQNTDAVAAEDSSTRTTMDGSQPSESITDATSQATEIEVLESEDTSTRSSEANNDTVSQSAELDVLPSEDSSTRPIQYGSHHAEDKNGATNQSPELELSRRVLPSTNLEKDGAEREFRSPNKTESSQPSTVRHRSKSAVDVSAGKGPTTSSKSFSATSSPESSRKRLQSAEISAQKEA